MHSIPFNRPKGKKASTGDMIMSQCQTCTRVMESRLLREQQHHYEVRSYVLLRYYAILRFIEMFPLSLSQHRFFLLSVFAGNLHECDVYILHLVD